MNEFRGFLQGWNLILFAALTARLRSRPRKARTLAKMVRGSEGLLLAGQLPDAASGGGDNPTGKPHLEPVMKFAPR